MKKKKILITVLVAIFLLIILGVVLIIKDKDYVQLIENELKFSNENKQNIDNVKNAMSRSEDNEYYIFSNDGKSYMLISFKITSYGASVKASADINKSYYKGNKLVIEANVTGKVEGLAKYIIVEFPVTDTCFKIVEIKSNCDGLIVKRNDLKKDKEYKVFSGNIIYKNKYFGYINEKGLIVIPADYKNIEKPYLNKKYLMLEKENGTFGLANIEGKIVIECKYKFFDSIKENYFLVCTANKSAIMNEKGEIIVNWIDERVSEFDNGYSFISSYDENSQKVYRGLVDEKLNIIIPKKYEELKIIGSSYVAGLNNEYGLFNKKGVMIYPLKCSDITTIGEFYKVDEHGIKGIIDKDGKIIIPVKYSNIDKFGDIFYVQSYYKYGKYGVINLKGKIILPVIYDEITIKDNYYEVKINNEIKKINK